MANVYYKILNRNINTNYAERVITDIQSELRNSAGMLKEDLFDVTKSMKIYRSTSDTDSLLKYYVISQLLKNMPELEKKNVSNRYALTMNKNIRKNVNENKYYRLSDGNWILAEDIVAVNNDGSYVCDEKKNNYSFIFRKTYSFDDNLIKIQLLLPNGKIVNNELQAVELAGMRKEFAHRYKYSGYSGNSSDIIAALLNRFVSPIETGLYMDRHYNLYSWNQREKCFIKSDKDFKSPLLTDYIFDSCKKVIRKEYTGTK